MAKRNIPHDPQDDGGGTMYDPARAYSEGLHEEVRLWSVAGVWGSEMDVQLIEQQLGQHQVSALLDDLFFDISANLPPGEVVDLTFKLKYRYDYGDA